MSDLKLEAPKPATQTGNLRLTRSTLNGSYDTWKQDPTPDNGATLFAELNPFIQSSIRRHVGDVTPVNIGRAKSLLIDALPRYDGRSSLPTFIDSQLQPLKRWSAKHRLGVKIPTAYAAQANMLSGISSELEDQLGRPPSSAELADRSGIPLERLTKLNQFHVPIMSERQSTVGGDEAGYQEAGDRAVADDHQLAVRSVYYSLNPVNQFIMESTLGLYGKPQLSNLDIAKRLRISPGAVSQRKNKIQSLMDSY